MSEDLDDKVVVVTGASRGLGRAVALELARARARVVVLARSKDELDQVAGEVRAVAGFGFSLQADVGNPNDVERVVEQLAAEVGTVDILINNAAVVWPLGPSASIDPAIWTQAILINVCGLAGLSFALLPAMLEQGWGRILNVSSGVAERPANMIGGNAYVTSKAAVEAHTRNLAAELAGTGVTVNAVHPGRVDTDMQTYIRTQPAEEVGAALHDRFQQFYDDGLLISAEKSARGLLSKLMTDINGEVWDVREN